MHWCLSTVSMATFTLLLALAVSSSFFLLNCGMFPHRHTDLSFTEVIKVMGKNTGSVVYSHSLHCQQK